VEALPRKKTNKWEKIVKLLDMQKMISGVHSSLPKLDLPPWTCVT